MPGMADDKRIAGKEATRKRRERRLAEALRANLRRRKAAEKPGASELPADPVEAAGTQPDTPLSRPQSSARRA
jgi:hypothetical protein